MAVANIPSCSFCGKDQKNVGKLIAGQKDVFICNECIDICNQVLPASTNTGKPHFEIVEQHMFCAVLYNYDWSIIENMQDWFRENDIRVWLRTHASAGMTAPSQLEDVFKIIFESESDLVAFKLRWI